MSGINGLLDIIPTIMVLDRDADSQDNVINIKLDTDTLILHALEDVTIAILGTEYPSGTLSFKAGQVLMLPVGVFSGLEE